jgi:dCMP deaminase
VSFLKEYCFENERKWEARFMRLAQEVASWSKDPSTQVGAVLVEPVTKRVISMGYNGFPRGVFDMESRYCDRPVKYQFVVHAELNAILAAKEPLDNATLYVTLSPCNECAKAVIQSGIRRVIYETLRENAVTNQMFAEAGIMMRGIYNG